MQVRCPHCDEVEGYADDAAWRKIPCKRCNRGFTVTSKLMVGKEEEGGTPGRTPAPAAARPARILGLVVVVVALVAGNALFARAWFSSRRELEALNEGLGGFEIDSGPASLAARKAKAGGAAGKADRLAAVKLVLELQAALIDDLNGKIERLKRGLDRARNALEREKRARSEANEKIDRLLEENRRLRRETDE